MNGRIEKQFRVGIPLNGDRDFRNPPPQLVLTNNSFDMQRVNAHGKPIMWVSNVFAPTREGELPGRFLRPFLTTFGLAEMIQQRTAYNVAPQVRILIPEHLIRTLNGIKNGVIDTQLQQGTDLITQLARNHFPTVEFFFERDKPLDQEGMRVLEEFAEIIVTNCNDEKIQKIRDKGFRRGGEEGARHALAYTADHMGGWSDARMVARYDMAPPITVVNTLAPAEKDTKATREIMKNAIVTSGHEGILCEGQRADLIIMMCDIAHYILIKDSNGVRQEPTTTELLESPQCGEILRIFEENEKAHSESHVRGHLRKARKDLERLLEELSGGNVAAAKEACFSDLLAGRVK